MPIRLPRRALPAATHRPRVAYNRWTPILIALALVALGAGWALPGNIPTLASAGDAPARALSGAPSARARSGEVPTQAVQVFQGHPRLILGGFRGLTPDALRAACAHEKMRGQCEAIGEGFLNDAMLYQLTGDPAAAARVRSWLLTGVDCRESVEESTAGGAALAYDWISPAITLAGHKERIEQSLAACGGEIARTLRTDGPHLWHGYSSRASALALIALALDDAPERDALLADALELFRGNALDAWAITGGAWPEGYSYARSHFFSGSGSEQYVLSAVLAWNSAVRRDHPDHAGLLETIAEEEGDWLRGFAYHLLYGTVEPFGDVTAKSLLRGGDMPTGQAYPNKQYRPFVDAIARAYGDSFLAGWGERLEEDWSFVGGTGTYHPAWSYLLPVTLPVDVASREPSGLPLARIWGRESLGYLIARSSWQPGHTLIGYRAGDWFTGHQHMDQGHIDLWHKGPLLVDSGVYADWGTTHREAYYMRTVAHNTLLIRQGGETFQQHPSMGDLQVNDGGQRIHTYNGCAQCMQTLDEWRSNLEDGKHFEAGRIEAFEDSGAAVAVRSDLTSAYNSTRYATADNTPKVANVERDLIFVRPDTLLVADRVVPAGDPRPAPPAFALHLPTRPDLVDPGVVEGTDEDGILTSEIPAFRVDNGTGGSLEVEVLAPSNASLTAIGGPGHRYWVDGANRLDGAVFKEDPPATPGQWRVELAPSEVSESYVLVTGMTVTDTGRTGSGLAVVPLGSDAAAPPALGVSVEGPSGRSLVVLSGAAPRQPVTFAVFELQADRLIAWGLVPGADYRVQLGSDTPKRLLASTEGSVLLESGFTGPGVLGLCPAPEGAGTAWTELCREPTPTPTPTPTATATPEPPEGEALLPIALNRWPLR